MNDNEWNFKHIHALGHELDEVEIEIPYTFPSVVVCILCDTQRLLEQFESHFQFVHKFVQRLVFQVRQDKAHLVL